MSHDKASQPSHHVNEPFTSAGLRRPHTDTGATGVGLAVLLSLILMVIDGMTVTHGLLGSLDGTFLSLLLLAATILVPSLGVAALLTHLPRTRRYFLIGMGVFCLCLLAGLIAFTVLVASSYAGLRAR